VGFDLNQSNLEYLKSGEISFLINQKPEYQGYSAIKGLYKFLTEKNNEDLNINIPVEIIVKENAL
jgi:LacI family transcriptional regulator